MDGTALLAQVPAFVRDLVIGKWPGLQVEGMRRCGDSYMQACKDLNTAADKYETEARLTEDAVTGETKDGLAERHRKICKAMRDKAAVCESLGRQFHDTADSAVQTQHLLVMTGIVLAAQLTYDMVLFFQGGGLKALADRLAAEQVMRAATIRFTVGVAENVAAGAARRAALHGAVHAAKVGALSGAAISVGAQTWDIAADVRAGFDVASFLEMVLGGVVGGCAQQFAGLSSNGELKWKDHGLTQSQVSEIRARVERLQPVFEAAGIRHLYNGMVRRLYVLEEHADTMAGPERVTAPRLSPPPTAIDTITPDTPNGTGADHSGEVEADAGPPIDSSGTRVGPATVSDIASVRLDLGDRPPVRIDPDRPMVINAEEPYPFTMNPQDAPADGTGQVVAGLTDSGKVWIRDDGTGEDVWVNGERVSPNQLWVLTEGDAVRVGSDLLGPVRTESIDDSRFPPAELSFGPDEAPLGLARGEQVLVDMGSGAHTPNGTTRKVIVGRDFDGRVWLRDPAPDANGPHHVKVGDKTVVSGDKQYVNPGESVTLGDRVGRLQVKFFREEVLLRFYDDEGVLPIPPNSGALLPFGGGRALETDAYGRVWIRENDPSDTNETYVNGERLGAGERRMLESGDSIRYGTEHIRLQMTPMDAVGDADPVRLTLGSGPEAAPVRLEAGRPIEVGTEGNSPFSSQLRTASGVGDRHAVMVLDHDGRVRIRDTGESDGVWVNGEQIPPRKWVTLPEGADIGLGHDFVGTVRMGAIDDSLLPDARFTFRSERSSIPLGAGSRVHMDTRSLGDRILGKPRREVLMGRDFDGRVWVRDPDVDSSIRIEVDGRTVPPGTKRYVDPDAVVAIDGQHAKLQVVGEGRPLLLRLSDDENIAPFGLRPSEEVRLGGGSDTPLARELARHGCPRITSPFIAISSESCGCVSTTRRRRGPGSAERKSIRPPDRIG
ncbi:FHA domain-containing protein [Nocardia brevicatena]|uniref:FHA domain-containing protein n=1 Tax=Nocardia brevicatena TaxID=37327 RepID=UPI0002F92F1E|nr:FHA domain-containing protein [Nocardia brevicatena]